MNTWNVFAISPCFCILLLGCGEKPAPKQQAGVAAQAVTTTLPGASFSLAVLTPAGMPAVNVALAATSAMTIGSGVQVVSGASGPGVIANLGSGGIDIEPDAQVMDVHSGSLVALRDRVHVNGTVFAPAVTQGSNVLLTGGVVSGASVTPAEAIRWTVVYPSATAQAVDLEPGQTSTLTPGRYTTVRVASRATLTLNSGAYYVDSLQLEPQSSLLLQQDSGPIVINATTVLQLRGQLAAVGGGHPDLLLVEVGSSDVFVETPFDGAIVAPNASVTLRSVTPGHTGFFYGQHVTVDPRTIIAPRPALPLLVAGGVDIADCARAVPLRADLTGRAQEIAYQEDVTRYCSMQGEDGCIASLYGLANADQYAAATQLATQVATPSAYLAISRDRRRKLFAAETNVATAVALCTGHDADGDWIPDPIDQCPNTPDLTPTDDRGCPLPTSAFPAAPSATDVASVLSTMGVLYSPNCQNAPLPPLLTAGAFYYPGIPDRGSYILAERIPNQPTNCIAWYDFQVEELASSTGRIATMYHALFLQTEETQNLVGTGSPVPPGYIQFNPLPSSTGAKHGLATAGGRARVRFRVRGVNVNGQRGPWSPWKLTDNHDCLLLGFQCG